ncbi:hypothetical protein HDU98_002520 [Podochytrium sp. JEL0797]|nr:hypothetical protein HDU98_002520 [Podochytrium sp. JEL0797]
MHNLTMDTPNSHWLLLLLADSALPTGGFIASSGLESFAGLNQLTNKTKLTPEGYAAINSFIASNISALAFSALPYLSQVHNVMKGTGSVAEKQETVKELDASYHGMIATNEVALRASLAQGAAFLSVLDRAFSVDLDAETLAIVKGLKKLLRLDQLHGHLPIYFSVLCASLGVTLEEAQALFLFHHVRSLVSSAVRLNIYGPYEGQRQMKGFGSVVENTLTRVRARMAMVEQEVLENAMKKVELEQRDEGVFDIFYTQECKPVERELVALAKEQSVQNGIVVEVVQGLHDRMYSRLFNS